MEKNINNQVKELILKKYPTFKLDILDELIDTFIIDLFKDQQIGVHYMQYYLDEEIIAKFVDFVEFYGFKCKECGTDNLHYYPKRNSFACAFC